MCVHLENGMTWNDSQRVAQAPQLQIGGCLFHWLQSCWLGSILTALLTSGGLNNDTSCSIQCILQSFNAKTLYDRLLRVAKFPRHAKNGASRWWMSGHPQWHLLAARWISREIPHRNKIASNVMGFGMLVRKETDPNRHPSCQRFLGFVSN